MEFSTTSKPTAESFTPSSNMPALLELLLGDPYRRWVKILVPVLIAASIATCCFLAFWFSGSGWISNSSIKHNVNSIAMPGTRFGSQTVYAKEGQTIEVDVELHEVKAGGLYVKIVPVRWGVPYKEFTTMIVDQAGHNSLTRTAEASGEYKIEFLRQPEKTKNLVRLMYGGQTDLCYSASWRVN